jgi:hypothetical protein
MHELPDHSFSLFIVTSRTRPCHPPLSRHHRWDLDDNRLANIHEYDINVGKGKKMYDGHDAAPGALFALVTKVMMINSSEPITSPQITSIAIEL